MAWIKVPEAHHALFRAALPAKSTTKQMFGSTAAFVNDKMYAAVFARSMMVKLDDAARADALALDGAQTFDPLGNRRGMRTGVLLPEDVMEDPAEMRMWLERAYAYVAALPPKRRAKTKAPKAKPTTPTKRKPKPKPKAGARSARR
ncbi:MAG TPA: TfoX/Sxy family protein [Kofleriaceae bacterium]|nr:TfoX/Sxy family protein [Kofleriaceae bacterium]